MNVVPEKLKPDLAHAVRLEWWTLGWQISIVALMALVLGSSQAMKTAWIEDLLGLVPAIVFLLAVHFEHKAPSQKFPFGYTRVNSLAFLGAATVLGFMGLYLIYDSGSKLLAAEHPTLGPVHLFGQNIWIGWLMIAALLYSIVPPVILGRKKQPVARALADKVLHTDALMQKADWMTGAAGIVGILGVGFGFWWADSAAALLIAFDILHDGYRATRVAMAELIDGAPRKLGGPAISDDAKALRDHLAERFPGADVRLRETGRYIWAEVHGIPSPPDLAPKESYWAGDPEKSWRLAGLSFSP
ncbi:cation diffusion facilitator family transporter [Pseudoroseicyclus tamaricis]|uniref:Cation transporter n=1 Tax=Pseudoroseicyclus tamaricis TaxID=2705421 RepID=A0A6B2JU58_9RHOB|nr:cation transporter [Pseudoroseicyclus tamaricis]NDV02077.1 cation transporter [Pseudoroseicyclus tamaricis]